MDERQVEDLLKRYRPAGPPDALRARCLTPPPVARVWPWAAAAAALLAIVVGSQAAVAGATVGANIVTAPDDRDNAVAALTEAFGGDGAARRTAEQIVDQQMRRERDLAERPSPPVGEPQ